MNLTYGNAYDRLTAEGIRMTHQRKIILDYLYERRVSHPTAEELFEAIYVQFPKVVSRPTIYKNIHLLQSFGLLKACYIAHSPIARYDTRVLPHHHLHCTYCGSISDLEGGVVVPHATIPGFQAESVYMEISGICEACSRTLPGQKEWALAM
ncbi:Fur family transcriptional regulator [Paenibacillus rigui]|uniref:Fur family transcriptional regulator n=1 Tax=Paenibacillus rigui TaxID=554312 RepID=A0A229ULW4_9BACL|nr:transcriptional repressor [Paenibacillus rigui]OXM84294.1 Fur family transcriptional regulator [Paenibacillus rigui]